MAVANQSYVRRGGPTTTYWEGMNVSVDQLEPNGTEKALVITVGSTSASFGAIDNDTSHLWWQCQSNQCRFTIDGATPTTACGFILNSGDTGIWALATASAARFIRTSSASTADAIIIAFQMK